MDQTHNIPHHFPKFCGVNGFVDTLLDLVLAEEVRAAGHVKVGEDASGGVEGGQGEHYGHHDVQVEAVVANLKIIRLE